MRNSQNLPPQQAQMQAAQQAQVAAWQAAQAQAQEQAAAQQAAQAAQQQAAAAQAQAQAAAQAQAQAAAAQAAEYAQAQAAWAAQQEQAMQQQQQAYYMQPAAPSGRAIGSLICGILAIVMCASGPVGLILGIVGLVLALRSNKVFGKTGTSKGGLICSIVGAVLSLATTVGLVLLSLQLSTAIATGTLPFNLDSLFGSSTPTTTTTTGSGSSRNSQASAMSSDGEEQARSAVSSQLTSIQNDESSALQEIATVADQSFQQTYGASMASCSIDPLEYARLMTENFSYDIDTVVIADTQGGHSYANVTVSCRDVRDVKRAFDEALAALESGTDLSAITAGDAASQIGEAFITAVNNAPSTANAAYAIDVKDTSGSWSVDPTSWNQWLTQVFGLA